jgi:hypothetical protein
MDALPLLRANAKVSTGVFAGLAGVVGVAGMVFRHIARRAAESPCATEEIGMEAHCAMAQGLGSIAAVLLPLAIAFFAAAAFCGWWGWRGKPGGER